MASLSEAEVDQIGLRGRDVEGSPQQRNARLHATYPVIPDAHANHLSARRQSVSRRLAREMRGGDRGHVGPVRRSARDHFDAAAFVVEAKGIGHEAHRIECVELVRLSKGAHQLRFGEIARALLIETSAEKKIRNVGRSSTLNHVENEQIGSQHQQIKNIHLSMVLIHLTVFNTH